MPVLLWAAPRKMCLPTVHYVFTESVAGGFFCCAVVLPLLQTRLTHARSLGRKQLQQAAARIGAVQHNALSRAAIMRGSWKQQVHFCSSSCGERGARDKDLARANRPS